MAVSLKDVEARVRALESYITAPAANNYIATRGTVNNANRLGNIAASSYRCNGSCSWTSSGGAKAVTWPT